MDGAEKSRREKLGAKLWDFYDRHEVAIVISGNIGIILFFYFGLPVIYEFIPDQCGNVRASRFWHDVIVISDCARSW